MWGRDSKKLAFLATVLAQLLSACAQTSPAPPSPTAHHVFLIVMENKTPAQALTGSFTSTLASKYGVADDYRAITHPSVPNYLAIASGSTWNVTDDSYHALPKQDLGSQLTSAGIAWRAYMQGYEPGGCLTSPLPYDPGHNPFAFFGGGCPSNVVPLTNLDGDLATAASTPRFAWIGPDQCNDEHSCPVSAGDDWLRQTVGRLMASPAWNDKSVLFVTWDEDDGSGDNHVLTLVVASGVGHHTSHAAYNHYSLLASIELLLGVKRLGEAAAAPAMLDLLPG
jgi:phosphatidylinositol-3-phosphatase